MFFLCLQIRRKLRSLEGLLQFRGNEQHISHTAHKLSIGAFALQTALDKVRLSAACQVGMEKGRGRTGLSIGAFAFDCTKQVMHPCGLLGGSEEGYKRDTMKRYKC